MIDLQSGNAGQRKSFAYKEGLKWSHSNKLNSKDFSNRGKKIFAENLQVWGKCK